MRRSLLKGLAFFVAIVCTCAQNGRAQVSDIPVEGDILLYFTSLYDQQGNHTGYRYDGAQVGVSLNANIPVVIPIGIKDSRLGMPCSWNEPSNWNGILLQLTNIGNIVKAVVNDGVGHPSFTENWQAWKALVEGGPTEKTFSQTIVEIDVPGLNLSFGTGLAEKFDVYLVSGADVLMDQTVILERLTVYSGAHVTGNSTFVTRTDLLNYGLFDNLMGTVQGNFVNTGALSQGEGAWIAGPLNVQGQLLNMGEIRIPSGSLILSMPTANDGTIVVEGGSLQFTNLANWGTIEWRSNGWVGNGQLVNRGTLRQVGGANVIFAPGDGRVDNLTGGLYEIQGDGGIIYTNWYETAAQFNNSGTLRKSAGSGVSVIGRTDSGWTIIFSNTGTVEVDSGTLKIAGRGGTSTGLFDVASGAVLEFAGQGHTFGEGARFTGEGLTRLTCSMGEGISFDGAVAVEGRLQVSGDNIYLRAPISVSGEMELAGGLLNQLTDAGQVKVTGTFDWTGGSLSAPVSIEAVARGNISGNGFRCLRGRTIENAGTMVWTGSGLLAGSSGAISNLVGGLFDIQNDSLYYFYDIYGGSPPAFNNAGVLRKSGGTGTTTFDGVIFSNTGTVEVDSGTLSLRGGVTQLVGRTLIGGEWKVGPNSALEITAGEHVTVNRATVVLDGPNSLFAKFDSVSTNEGDLTILNGRSFTTASDFTNSGIFEVGTGSTFTVTGEFTQTDGYTTVDGQLRATAGWAEILGGTLELNSDAGAGGAVLSTGVANATVYFDFNQHLDTLVIEDGGKVVFAGANCAMLKHLANAGTIDVATGNLVVDYDGSSPLAAVRAMLASGCAGGTWDGPGFASSVAADDVLRLTALGILDNADPEVGGKTTFEGEPVDATAILVKYTWWGDANLDGVVDANDYDVIDKMFLLPPVPDNMGWWTGDFNYDGVIDANDYDRIDRAFLFQTGPLAPAAAAPLGQAMPATEPSAEADLLALALASGMVVRPAPGLLPGGGPLVDFALVAPTGLSAAAAGAAAPADDVGLGLTLQVEGPAAAASPWYPPAETGGEDPGSAPDGDLADLLALPALEVL